jgi:NADPH-dependent ferric siderophore reductase
VNSSDNIPTPAAAIRAANGLKPQRVRHISKFRMLEVARIHAVNPHLLRVTFVGEELAGFQSASFDDHVKLYFPAPGEVRPVRPAVGPSGLVFPEGVSRPVSRDFTPRRYDPKTNELDLEFALHEAGPASDWARQARPGQYLGLGGPRGSMIIPTGFDWHLLIGDETALPAIARRLEELPAHTVALAIGEVENASWEVEFSPRTEHQVIWCHRGSASERGVVLMRELRRLRLPRGEGFAWAAGESAVIREVRSYLCNERGIDKGRIRAASYWKRGAQGVHEVFED